MSRKFRKLPDLHYLREVLKVSPGVMRWRELPNPENDRMVKTRNSRFAGTVAGCSSTGAVAETFADVPEVQARTGRGWFRSGSRYRAQVKRRGKTVLSETFKTEAEARAAYLAAKRDRPAVG